MSKEAEEIAQVLGKISKLVKDLDEDVSNLYEKLTVLFEKAEDVESRFKVIEKSLPEADDAN